jgi:glycosyltransferase involved in cell wall biosynthesis
VFGLGLARLLPRRLRAPLIAFVEAGRILRVDVRIGLAGRVKAWRDWQPLPPTAETDAVAIMGLFATRTGLGQGARLLAASLERQGRTVARIDVTRHFTAARGLDPAFLGKVPRKPRCPTVVICLNPPEFLLAYLRLPLRLRFSARIVGYWAWELETLPADWFRSLPFADEIWVPSRFVADAVARALPEGYAGRVRIVPHDVAAMPLGPRQTDEIRRDARRRQGLDEEAFTVGYSFAMGSNCARKNPVAAVRAFLLAFPPDGPVRAHLLIRCNEAQAFPAGIADIEAAIAGDARITLAIEAAQKPPILDFYHMLDCYLSLHRSEGYGLNLAEAASLGIPVIATGWGLADDIAAMPGVETVSWRLVPVDDPQGAYAGLDARWADADIAEAAWLLQRRANGLL